MKFKTFLALCLFAFSPLALASNHADCKCCDHAKHEQMKNHKQHDKHVALSMGKHEAKHKICKDGDHKQHAKHMAMSADAHASHKMTDHQAHKKMEKMCDIQCEECCEDQCSDCADCGDCGDCKQCSAASGKPDMQHQGH